jgi:MFS family permease
MLILHVTRHAEGTLFGWGEATLAIALYVLHNAVSALAAFPIGMLSDRFGRGQVVASGYWLAAGTTFGFAFLGTTPAILIGLFIGSWIYIACEEVAEKAYATELLLAETRGTGMGLLAATNGIGDVVSSALVGALWAAAPSTPAFGFIAAGCLQAFGARVVTTARAASVARA